jgi:uncharacterized protein (DUF983 family)
MDSVDYPNCKGTRPITTGVKCPKCEEGELMERFLPKQKRNFGLALIIPNAII